MKKVIKVLMAVMFSGATTSSIIACTNPFIDPSVIRIAIVTDGHPINDKSFNESSYNGALQFKKEFEDWIKNTNDPDADEWKTKKIVVTPIMPPTIDENNFFQSYGQAIVMDSTMTIASGFVQSSALVRAQKTISKNYTKMKYIYVDGDTLVKDVGQGNKKLAGLLFSAEQSGLMAAVAGAVWLIAHNGDYGGLTDLKVSTYGGSDIPTVTSYMYGFLWGIDLVNKYIKDEGSFGDSLRGWVKTLNPEVDDFTNFNDIQFINLQDQFTGNFNQGSTSSKAINQSLVREGADIIFPVAGPQTSDTLAALENSGNGKVIGVDSDQILQYSESADRFITSALKNITASVDDMLWKGILYHDASPEHKKLDPVEVNKIFETDAESKGGTEYIGIADNPAITSIYGDDEHDGIMNNQDLASFLQKVTKGWQDVSDNAPNDLWNYGKTYNPWSIAKK